MFRKVKAWIRRKQTAIKAVTTNQRGEFYVDKVIGMIIAVAEGNCDRRLAACRTVRLIQQYGFAGADRQDSVHVQLKWIRSAEANPFFFFRTTKKQNQISKTKG